MQLPIVKGQEADALERIQNFWNQCAWATTEIANISVSAEAAGTSNLWARADHVHFLDTTDIDLGDLGDVTITAKNEGDYIRVNDADTWVDVTINQIISDINPDDIIGGSGIDVTDGADTVINGDVTLDLGLLTSNWDAGGYQIRALQFYADGAADAGGVFFGDTTQMWQSAANRLYTPDALHQPDGAAHYFGTDDDFDIQHDGSHGYISNHTGQLLLNVDGLSDIRFFKLCGSGVNTFVYTFGWDSGESTRKYMRQRVNSGGDGEIQVQHGDLYLLTDLASSSIILRTAASGGMLFDGGGIFTWRDVDAASAVRMTLDSATGNLSVTGTVTSTGRVKATDRITGNTTLGVNHEDVFADTDGGAITVTLPVGVDGTRYRIINTGSSGNDVTVTPNGAELLLGANSSLTMIDSEVLIITYEATEGWW
jgi:hypothetical protein